MANVGGPNNNQPQPGLQAFKNAADGARDNTQIKVRDGGNVGTRSLFGRAWRAVTPVFSGRRASNMRDVNSFKAALLKQNNQEQDVGLALDECLPGHKNGNVPLTAGAVRRSIEYLNILNMPVASAVDRPQFRDITDEEYATESLDFYIAAKDMLGNGNNVVDVQRFKAFVTRFVDEETAEDELVNITGDLRDEITQFVADCNGPRYSAEQAARARQLLEKAQQEVGKLMFDPLKKFKETLLRQLD